MALPRAQGERLLAQRAQVDAGGDVKDSKDRTHAVYPLSRLAIAATKPGPGKKLSNDHPDSSPGVFSKRRISARSPGASDPSKPASGRDKPPPSAQGKAALRA